jgi:hypothetical protein
MKLINLISENINIPVKVGDTILTGRFKNKKVVVKSIGKDKHGMPTVNGRKVVTFRLMKELSEEMMDDADLGLERGKVYVLQADSTKHKRGLIVRLLPDGGYDIKYWYDNPKNIYPVEVFIDGKSITKDGKVIKLGFHPELKEDVPMGDLRQVDSYADDVMGIDMVLTDKHFFDRVNDPRNTKEIWDYELMDFFDKLADNKQEFLDFLKKYKETTVTDRDTSLNIPFMRRANKIIAKTIMRKFDFKSKTPKMYI